MIETLKPLQSLYRRISIAILLVLLLIAVIYVLNYFGQNESGFVPYLIAGDQVSIVLGAALVIAVVACAWTPKKYPMVPSFLTFTAFLLTSVLLIHQTGGTYSPFITLFVLAAASAGIFGFFGVLPVALVPIAYFGWQYFKSNALPGNWVMDVLFLCVLPLLISCIIWTRQKGPKAGHSAYQQLASELSQVANKSEVVIGAITDGVIALDQKGNLQLINPAAQAIVGWGKHDAITLNYRSVFKLTDANNAELTSLSDPIAQALATNQSIRTDELLLITNSGKKLFVSLVISPVGQPGSGVIIVFRDITKEKAEGQQQAEFISTASHEMRTPVASIEGYLGLSLNPSTAQIDDKAREYLTKAHEAAQHLGRLFQDLLDVSRAEDGRLSNNPSVVDVVAFIHDIAQGLRPKAEQKGLTMIFKPQPDSTLGRDSARRLNPVFYVNVDNDHLREVISNLVDNAIKYTPHGTVSIDVVGDSEHVKISIEDSGIGIPAEDVSHLFQKFYRVDNSDTREIGGTGLGLYLCRRLTETMEGRIWVESRYKQGSTFYLELPRISHEDATRIIETLGEKSEEDRPLDAVMTNPVDRDIEAARQVPTPDPTTVPIPETIPKKQSIPVVDFEQPNVPLGPSLTTIENNPDKYLRRPGSFVVPPRDQNQP